MDIHNTLNIEYNNIITKLYSDRHSDHIETIEEDQGVWSEFAEEGLAGDFGLDPTDFSAKDLSDIDTMLELENEMVRGK